MQLSVQNVNQYYGGSHILRDISFEIKENALTALLGRNGAGKTTLLRSLLGVVPIRDGQIHYAGKNISQMSTAGRIAQGIGYVPQGREIFPRLSVKENLLVGAATLKQPKGIPAYIYQLFPVLKEMEHRNGGDLSGGQQQQLAIARALMGQPRLLILDEPTEGIQPNIIQHIGRTLKSLVADHGITVLLVEQYLDFVKSIADDYLVMNRGVIIASGKGANIDADGIERHISV